MKKNALVGVDTTINPNVTLKEKRLAKIIDLLYRAIILSKGLYATITIETHAPQQIYFPGSSESRSKNSADVSSQQLLFHQDVSSHAHDQEHENRQFALVKPGTLEHRQWLWFATLTDRRENSMQVYRAHCHIYADYPELYTEAVSYISLPKLRSMLDGKYKIGSPKQSVEYWQICAFTLFSRFGGDPVTLLKHAGWSVEAVYAWKQAQKKPISQGGIGYDPIPGWGRKLLSLYFLYLAELGYPLPEDVFASDVHAQAIVLQTGSFDYGERDIVTSATLAEMIRKFVSLYCKEKKYDIVLVSHASWLLGSTLCNQCSQRREVPVSCPIYEECGGRVDTSHYWKKGTWPKDVPRMNKGGERPKFGLPTDVVRRLSQRGKVNAIPITPLFSLHRKK